MGWRVAKSLDTLLEQINTFAPRRSKISDGSIGDASHASRSSDHNAWVKDGTVGIVTARDYTHDPVGGFDAYKFADVLKANNDPRIKYVISNRRIWTPSISKAWRPYTGVNPHNHHTHVSVDADKPHYDSTMPWDLTGMSAPAPAINDEPPPAPLPNRATLKKGSKGGDVFELQRMLNNAGASPALKIDGDFGKATLNAVMSFQKARGLVRDGKVGLYTWLALGPVTPSGTSQPYERPLHAGPDFDNVVKHYEGKSNEVYVLDGLAHAGWGHADKKLKPGTLVDDVQCQIWFDQDKKIAEDRLNKWLRGMVNQRQYDALCSIVWNGGNYDDPKDEKDSPLFYHTKKGVLIDTVNREEWATASAIIEALGTKPTATGKIFAGILNRRMTEAELFRGDPYKLR